MREVLDRCRETGQRPSVRPILEILVAAAEGLHAAHRVKRPDGTTLGIVHRDVKPGNILVGHNEEVKVADFGVAHFEDRFVESTALGQMKGTPAYMAPEQVLGQDVDHRTDVFSLGVTLYTLLTGKLAFTAETPVAVALKLVRESMEPHARELEGIQAGLGPILSRACAPLRENRFTSAMEMAAALRAVAMQSPQGQSVRELIEWAGWRPWTGEGTTDEVSLSDFDSGLRRFGGETVAEAHESASGPEVESATRAWQGDPDDPSLFGTMEDMERGGDSEDIATDPHVRAATGDHSAVLSTQPVSDDSLHALSELESISSPAPSPPQPSHGEAPAPTLEAPAPARASVPPSPTPGPRPSSRPAVPRPISQPASVLAEFAATVPIRAPSRPAAPLPTPPKGRIPGSETTAPSDAPYDDDSLDAVGVTPIAEILAPDADHVASLPKVSADDGLQRLRPPPIHPPPLVPGVGGGVRGPSFASVPPVSGPLPKAPPPLIHGAPPPSGPAPVVPGPIPRAGPRAASMVDSERSLPPAAGSAATRKAQPELDYRGRVVKGAAQSDAPPGGFEKALVGVILLLLIALFGALWAQPDDDAVDPPAPDAPAEVAPPPDLPARVTALPSPAPPAANPAVVPAAPVNAPRSVSSPAPGSTPMAASTQNASTTVPAPTPSAPRPDRSSPPTKDTAPSAGLGRLTVNSYPWSDVLVDGKFVGRTPVEFHELPAGSHEVRLRFENPAIAEIVEFVTIQPGLESKVVRRVPSTSQATPAP